MGQACQRRASPASQAENDSYSEPICEMFGKPESEDATQEDKNRAVEICQQCRLAYSRVATQSINQKKTIGQLLRYVQDMQDREAMLNGFDGEDDRVREGLAGG
eukprot:CAMPEP_0206426676 /NCGR_PEP_ID=MMETSP0324_2-20121206/4519_1 /ASSEMBLY_ACC=CAM_ASM_000836 /TAXON_ID=2866 /ORGANISM="Crypthecodinium cohnii, Strain Seligo" /LENGTH=103 /DNA_ID=CAMNT_0053891675 /DNA_START=35 /DNA_END=346 /DNA_ORIENTATION=-